MNKTAILIILASILALSIATPATAQNTRDNRGSDSIESEGEWTFGNYRTGDFIVIAITPNEYSMSPDDMLDLSADLVPSMFPGAKKTRVHADYADSCQMWKIDVDGTPAYFINCITDEIEIMIIGTDKSDSVDMMEAAMDGDEIEPPSGYQEMDLD